MLTIVSTVTDAFTASGWDIAVNLLSDFIVTLVAVMFAKTIGAHIEERRWGGWRIKLIEVDGDVAIDRAISVSKAKTIFADDTDLAMFVKTIASTQAWLNCDPLSKGVELGLFTIDRSERRMVIDLRCNPPKPTINPAEKA